MSKLRIAAALTGVCVLGAGGQRLYRLAKDHRLIVVSPLKVVLLRKAKPGVVEPEPVVEEDPGPQPYSNYVEGKPWLSAQDLYLNLDSSRFVSDEARLVWELDSKVAAANPQPFDESPEAAQERGDIPLWRFITKLSNNVGVPSWTRKRS